MLNGLVVERDAIFSDDGDADTDRRTDVDHQPTTLLDSFSNVNELVKQ